MCDQCRLRSNADSKVACGLPLSLLTQRAHVSSPHIVASSMVVNPSGSGGGNTPLLEQPRVLVTSWVGWEERVDLVSGVTIIALTRLHRCFVLGSNSFDLLDDVS